MWEAIQAWFQAIGDWGGWDEVGAGGVWLMTTCLFVIGLVGCVVPVIPRPPGDPDGCRGASPVPGAGLRRGLVHLRGDRGVAGGFADLRVRQWGGGGRNGSAGPSGDPVARSSAGLVGIFFMPFGLILGPLLGAYAFEAWFAKQEQKPAIVSGVGSAVGTLAGIAVKSAVGAVMVIWFFIEYFPDSIGRGVGRWVS